MGGKDAGLSVRELSVASHGRWPIRGVTFDVRRGGVHLILGERDTGKTALLETIAGIRAPEAGTVSLEGEEAPAKARRRRIAFLPREAPVLQLQVVERLLLHQTPRIAKLGTDWKRGREEARELAARVGLDSLLDVPCEALRPLERKLIELAAVIRQRPAALLVDEPTTDLGPHEARHFLATLGDLARAEGLPVVLSTVWPRDAYPIAGTVTVVWRAAEPVTVSTSDATEAALVQRWTGGLDIRRAPTGPHNPGDTLMRVEGLILK
jgi:ABC-type sugar transport system ATPase subunit